MYIVFWLGYSLADVHEAEVASWHDAVELAAEISAHGGQMVEIHHVAKN